MGNPPGKRTVAILENLHELEFCKKKMLKDHQEHSRPAPSSPLTPHFTTPPPFYIWESWLLWIQVKNKKICHWTLVHTCTKNTISFYWKLLPLYSIHSFYIYLSSTYSMLGPLSLFLYFYVYEWLRHNPFLCRNAQYAKMFWILKVT